MSHAHAGHTRKPVFTQSDLDFARKFFPNLRSIAGHNLVDALQLKVADPFYVTFLREPIARVLSNYQDGVMRGDSRLSFEETLKKKEKCENLAVKLIAGERNLDKAKRFLERCHMVGFTENFNLSLHVLQRLCPYPLKLNYRRRVVAKDNQVKKAIQNDPRLLDMAREYNQLDLALYDFALKEIFPKLCQQASFSPSDKVSSFEMHTNELRLKFMLGRVYNKLFRQVCKLRR